MNLRTDNLTIRRATAEDAPLLCAWWNDGQVMAHAGFPHGLGISEQKIVALLAQDNDENRRLILDCDGQPIGEMNYRTVAKGIAEIGIKICAADKQNRGLGPRYLRMLLGHLFGVMAYKKVILDTNLKNERAQHVYEKLGFRRVRTNIDSWQDQDDVWQSSVDYELSSEAYFRE
jgi:RimJ/RimL family protein N-acetyltransferase